VHKFQLFGFNVKVTKCSIIEILKPNFSDVKLSRKTILKKETDAELDLKTMIGVFQVPIRTLINKQNGLLSCGLVKPAIRLESLSRLSRLLLGGEAGPEPRVEEDTEEVAMAGTAYTCSVLPEPLDWVPEGTFNRSLPMVS